MRKNRSLVVLVCLFYLLSIILQLSVVFIDYSINAKIIISVVFIVGTFLYIACKRCPYCHQFRLRINPLAAEVICKKCGKHITFDD